MGKAAIMRKDQLAAGKEWARTTLHYSSPFIFTPAKPGPEGQLHRYNVNTLKREVEDRNFNGLVPSESELRLMCHAATIGNDAQAACDLLELAGDLLMEDRALPNPLQKYVFLLIQDHVAKLRKKRGRKGETNFGRDWFIATTVHRLQDFGFRPTRNREEKRRESGCSIVAALLAERGLNMSELNIESIWKRVTTKYRNRIEEMSRETFE